MAGQRSRWTLVSEALYTGPGISDYPPATSSASTFTADSSPSTPAKHDDKTERGAVAPAEDYRLSLLAGGEAHKIGKAPCLSRTAPLSSRLHSTQRPRLLLKTTAWSYSYLQAIRNSFSPHTLISGRPAKARMRLDSRATDPHQVSYPSSGLMPAPPGIISMFPTSNQPVLDSTPKEMLQSLHSSLQADMLHLIPQFKQEVSILGNRVEHMEARMGDYANTINDVIDTQEAQSEEQIWIKDKIADIEDWSLQNYIKIRGISEEIQDLSTYVRGLIKTLLPELKNIKLVIDRIHRLPKPKHLPGSIPRDVILLIHFYHTKDQLM